MLPQWNSTHTLLLLLPENYELQSPVQLLDENRSFPTSAMNKYQTREV